MDTIRLARNDREAILKIMERVPASERKLLPDVVQTVDALLRRAEELARMLHGMSGDVDDGALARIEIRIEAVKQHEQGSERDRQIDLLERQRQTLRDLLARRRRVEEQIESCVLAMQNVRFDLLRLRSAGVAAVLSDLTHATQQARALSRDVDHVIAAAGEVKAVLGEQSGARFPSAPGRGVPLPVVERCSAQHSRTSAGPSSRTSANSSNSTKLAAASSHSPARSAATADSSRKRAEPGRRAAA